MIDCHDDPFAPPDEDDFDPLIGGMHPTEWPTMDDLLEVTKHNQMPTSLDALKGPSRVSVIGRGEDS